MQYRIIKAAKKCGLNVVPRRTYDGKPFVGLIYNKFGDSYAFNPLVDVGHAVYMLSILGGSLSIANKESKCIVYLESDPESVVEGRWVTKPKNKDKNICNAIINCILTKGKKSWNYLIN